MVFSWNNQTEQKKILKIKVKKNSDGSHEHEALKFAFCFAGET